MIKIKEIESFENFGKCLSISNGIIEALVTTDIGPRIISFGYVGGQNIMCSDREGLGSKSDKKFTDFFGKNRKWENLGGHRIWLSPESYPETYNPDDKKVEYRTTENGAVFTPAPETENGVQKTLEIKMDPDDANMQVIMTAENIGKADKDFAIWGLSVCHKGGKLIVPMNTNDTGLLSNRIVSVWPYTDMSDNRISWGNKYMTLRQDENADVPIKLGFDLNCGTVYYVLNDDIFCKKYNTLHPDAAYPDGGCSFETYTNACMIEIESLGELKTVKPGEISIHTESWSLYKKPDGTELTSDTAIDSMLEKI